MYKFFLMSLVCLLTACGFKLKGYPSAEHYLPTKNWQIEGGELQQPLDIAMRRVLMQKHADANNEVLGRIRVLSVQSNKDIYTITRANKLNEYLLSMHVVAQAYCGEQPWGESMNIDVRRVMPYADGLVLGKAEEEQMIWRELRQDAAEQIITRLAFLPVSSETMVSSCPR